MITSRGGGGGVYYEAGCKEAKHESVGEKNGGEASKAGSVRFLSIPSSCSLVAR